jgi:hypothetical protein
MALIIGKRNIFVSKSTSCLNRLYSRQNVATDVTRCQFHSLGRVRQYPAVGNRYPQPSNRRSSSIKSSNDDNSSGLFLWLGPRESEIGPSMNKNRNLLLLPVVQRRVATIYDDDSPEKILSIVNELYDNAPSDYIGGMGESDPGVWFAATSSSHRDALEYSELIQQGIELVKQERHGVPIGIYTSGIMQGTSAIALNEIGIDYLNVSLFASTPKDYQVATGMKDSKDAQIAFGRVCSLISDATEMGVSVKVGVIQSYASAARDLAYGLGAIEVDVFPDLRLD